MSTSKLHQKFYVCSECQQIRHIPYSHKDESCPKKCQACTRLWRKLLKVLSLCYVRWEEWEQKFPSIADSSDDHFPSVSNIRNVILSFMNEEEKKVFDKYHKHLIRSNCRRKPNLGQNKQLEKKPYNLKPKIISQQPLWELTLESQQPHWELTLESGQQKDFIIRCLSSFLVDLDSFIIVYQNLKIEKAIREESLLLEQKKSIEGQLKAKDQEIDDLRRTLKQTSITCPICLSVPEGGPHTRFECGHWMCQTCRKGFNSPNCHICKGPTSSVSKLYF